jgi:hypothetical protein
MLDVDRASDGQLTLRSTAKANAPRTLLDDLQNKSRADQLDVMARAVGAPPYPMPERENVSLAPLPDFTMVDYESAVERYRLIDDQGSMRWWKLDSEDR